MRVLIIKSDMGIYGSLGSTNFYLFVQIKKLLETFCLHQVNFKETVYILIMKVLWELTGHLVVVISNHSFLCKLKSSLRHYFCLHQVIFKSKSVMYMFSMKGNMGNYWSADVSKPYN